MRRKRPKFPSERWGMVTRAISLVYRATPSRIPGWSRLAHSPSFFESKGTVSIARPRSLPPGAFE